MTWIRKLCHFAEENKFLGCLLNIGIIKHIAKHVVWYVDRCFIYMSYVFEKMWYIGPIVYYSYPYSYEFLEAKMVESFR